MKLSVAAIVWYESGIERGRSGSGHIQSVSRLIAAFRNRYDQLPIAASAHKGVW